jgi:hypothetical protein
MKARTLSREWLPLLGLLILVTPQPQLASGQIPTCRLLPAALVVDPSLTGNSDANGLLEPGETVVVEPSWRQYPRCNRMDLDPQCRFKPPAWFVCRTTLETGTASSTSGEYLFLDRVAQYTLAAGPSAGPRSCASNQDCYSLDVPVPTQRPLRHWDATFTEALSGTLSATTRWTVHIGDSFADVPRTHLFYKPIETLFHNGATKGCTSRDYCPGGTVTRSELAILLAKTLAGGEANIPASGWANSQHFDCKPGGASLFGDVAPTDSFCRHAHYLVAQKVIEGCGSYAYCPAEPISRLEMAAFVARAKVAPGGDAAVPLTDSYDEPVYSCDPASPKVHFADVSVSNAFCKHVHFLWSLGVVAGCGPEQYCPSGIVARDQTAKFLVKAFALKL